jgi:hypothetical protein
MHDMPGDNRVSQKEEGGVRNPASEIQSPLIDEGISGIAPPAEHTGIIEDTNISFL